MDIIQLADGSGRISLGAIRGMVEEAHITLFFKVASLRLKVNGEYFYWQNSEAGVPPVYVGQEVLIHTYAGSPKSICDIQVIRDDKCILRISSSNIMR